MDNKNTNRVLHKHIASKEDDRLIIFRNIKFLAATKNQISICS